MPSEENFGQCPIPGLLNVGEVRQETNQLNEWFVETFGGQQVVARYRSEKGTDESCASPNLGSGPCCLQSTLNRIEKAVTYWNIMTVYLFDYNDSYACTNYDQFTTAAH